MGWGDGEGGGGEGGGGGGGGGRGGRGGGKHARREVGGREVVELCTFTLRRLVIPSWTSWRSV